MVKCRSKLGAILLGVVLSFVGFAPSVAALVPGFEWAAQIPAPDNSIVRMGMVFAGSVLFFHGALWTKLIKEDVWLKRIDYLWYFGAIASIAVGLWRLDVDVTNQRELDRWRDSAIASVAAIVHRLDEAEDELTMVDARQRLDDLCNLSGEMKVGSAGYEYCALVGKGDIETVCKLPPLPNYAFGSEPAPELKMLGDKFVKFLDRLLGLPQGEREKQFELARRKVCHFSQTSTALGEEERSTEELLSAFGREKEVIGVGPIVHLMALILALVAGLRITKTTAEVSKALSESANNSP